MSAGYKLPPTARLARVPRILDRPVLTRLLLRSGPACAGRRAAGCAAARPSPGRAVAGGRGRRRAPACRPGVWRPAGRLLRRAGGTAPPCRRRRRTSAPEGGRPSGRCGTAAGATSMRQARRRRTAGSPGAPHVASAGPAHSRPAPPVSAPAAPRCLAQMPPPLDAYIRTLHAQAMATDTAGERWLVPGRFPGQHLSRSQLVRRLHPSCG